MRWLAAALLLLLAPALATAQTAIRPDQICNPTCSTPDITWGPGPGGYVIGSTVAWRTDTGSGSPTPLTFTSADLGRVVELTFAGAITATLPDATGAFDVGAGLTIQVAAGTLTLNRQSASKINGLNTIKLGPYQSVGLISRGNNWYAQLSVPQPTTQTGTNVLADNMTWGAGGGGAFTANCTESSNFIARAATLNTTQKTNYDTMICGLVTDGTWALGDALYIYAAPTSTIALLNLISVNFSPSTAFGSPAFTANAGFLGINASSTVYIDTGMNPITATSPKYLQNSASLMAWSLTNVQATGSGGTAIGIDNSSFTQSAQIDLWTAASSPGAAFDTYMNINAATTPVYMNSVGTALGSWIGNRSGTNAIQAYHNGSAVTLTGGATAASVAPPSLNFYTLSVNINGAGGAGGVGNQIAAIWIGGSLDPTHALSLHNRVCAFLTTVHGSC